MRTADFDFTLPDRLIAQRPAACRDESRLLVVDRASGGLTHRPVFRELLHHLHSGDVLVLNNSQVIPARLRGRKVPTGGEIETLLVQEILANRWWTLLRPGKRVRVGTKIHFGARGEDPLLVATVLEKNAEGHCLLEFSGPADIRTVLDKLGEIPLPPYITRPADKSDRERYQTVFARAAGSVAAPTAGLHFTEELLCGIRERGIEVQYVTLHVGLGTFAPVKGEDIREHVMHEERFELAATTAAAIQSAKASGRRVIAVGTTTVRVLESVVAQNEGKLVGTRGQTQIFIYPPFRFRIVDGLLTNFHLPKSTLLMLVSAFAAPGETSGRELILKAYAEAVRREYRFFSYGDAMLIL